MNKTLATIGLMCTALYAGVMVYLLSGNLCALKSLPPNELGDFLAGAFGPIAIFWLILGFFQQGLGLKQNSEALRLQATELANSVEQQKQLVAVSREQFAAQIGALQEERENIRGAQKPKFVIAETYFAEWNEGFNFSFELHNIGSAITTLKINTPKEIERMHPEELPSFDRLTHQNFRFEYVTGVKPSKDAKIEFSYLDGGNNKGHTVFIASPTILNGKILMSVSEVES